MALCLPLQRKKVREFQKDPDGNTTAHANARELTELTHWTFDSYSIVFLLEPSLLCGAVPTWRSMPLPYHTHKHLLPTSCAMNEQTNQCTTIWIDFSIIPRSRGMPNPSPSPPQFQFVSLSKPAPLPTNPLFSHSLFLLLYLFSTDLTTRHLSSNHQYNLTLEAKERRNEEGNRSAW